MVFCVLVHLYVRVPVRVTEDNLRQLFSSAIYLDFETGSLTSPLTQ